MVYWAQSYFAGRIYKMRALLSTPKATSCRSHLISLISHSSAAEPAPALPACQAPTLHPVPPSSPITSPLSMYQPTCPVTQHRECHAEIPTHSVCLPLPYCTLCRNDQAVSFNTCLALSAELILIHHNHHVLPPSYPLPLANPFTSYPLHPPP